MDGRVGYEYHYQFSMADKDEINSLSVGISDEIKLSPKGANKFMFEIRSDFISRRSTEEANDIIIDSESYAMLVSSTRNGDYLCILLRWRMFEYWMSRYEVDVLSYEAFAFAEEMARQHPSLNIIHVVVHLEVCTVQQEGESWDATMNRAICKGRLIPLYILPQKFIVQRKPTSRNLVNFLFRIERIRVGEGDEVMKDDVCGICLSEACYGAQISVLPNCNHAFHSHCIVHWLEKNNKCPLCRSQAYHPCLKFGPSYE